MTVTASNLFSAANTQAFSFSINSFLSPPTNQPVDSLTISSYIEGSPIDSCSVYVSDLTPKTITTLAISSSSGSSIIVNAFYTIRFTFTLTDTLSQTDTITLTFPDETSLVFSSSLINSNFGANASSAVYDEDSLTLTMSIVNQGRTFAKGTSIQFTIGSYKAPPST